MSETMFVGITVLIISAVTILIRFFPFLIFANGRKTPAVINYLGKVLPYSIIGMLVVYCLKDTDILGRWHGLSELIASVLVIGIHYWKKNTLLSILAGTVCYMVLVQFVFV